MHGVTKYAQRRLDHSTRKAVVVGGPSWVTPQIVVEHLALNQP